MENDTKSNRAVCKFYLFNGNCKNGENCIFLHSQNTENTSQNNNFVKIGDFGSENGYSRRNSSNKGNSNNVKQNDKTISNNSEKQSVKLDQKSQTSHSNNNRNNNNNNNNINNINNINNTNSNNNSNNNNRNNNNNNEKRIKWNQNGQTRSNNNNNNNNNTNNNNNRNNNNNDEISCNYCKQKGHVLRNCPRNDKRVFCCTKNCPINCYRHYQFTAEDITRITSQQNEDNELHFNNKIDITLNANLIFTNDLLHHTIINRKFGRKSFHCNTFFLEKRSDSQHWNSKCNLNCREYQSQKNIYCSCGGSNKYDCKNNPVSSNHTLDKISQQVKKSIKIVGNNSDNLKELVKGTIHLIDMLGHVSTALILIKIPQNELNEARERFEQRCAENRGGIILHNQIKCKCPVDINQLRGKHTYLIPLQSVLKNQKQIKSKFPCCNEDRNFVVYNREKNYFFYPIMRSYFSYIEKNEGDLDDVFVLFMTEESRAELSFPGGQMEGNETHLETLIREVKEEIGVDLTNCDENIDFVHASCLNNRVLFLHSYFFRDYKAALQRFEPENDTTNDPAVLMQIPENNSDDKVVLIENALMNETDGTSTVLQILQNDSDDKVVLPENEEELLRRILNL